MSKKNKVKNYLNKNNQKPGKLQKKSRGGRTTISPPAKFSTTSKDSIKVLKSNIDTIVLSVDVTWEDTFFFATLKEAKMVAQLEKKECPVDFQIKDFNENNYLFNVKPHGGAGYEWYLHNNEYLLSICNSQTPNSRPSVLITIRSETLWRNGPEDAINFILSFLKSQNGKIHEPKISRLDLCLDALFPETIWRENILKYKVTLATFAEKFYFHNRLTGIAIGKGNIMARMYDKPLEIKQKSKKEWLYDVWGVKIIPEHHRIIRTEFQLRREVIKEIGIYTISDLFDCIQSIWAYCTKKWLKFQDNPGKQRRDRKTLRWWKEIQDGYNEKVSGYPIIRVKASNADRKTLCQQSIGSIISLAALEKQTTDYFDHVPLNLRTAINLFYDTVLDNEFLNSEVHELIENKIVKYQRIDKKRDEALSLRKSLGFK